MAVVWKKLAYQPANVITVAPTGADYSTVAGALAAASSGDIILLFQGTYNESNLTLVAGVTISGYQEDVCWIYADDDTNPIVNCAVNCDINNIGIANANSAQAAIKCTTGAQLVARHCWIDGHADGDAIQLAGGTFYGHDCMVEDGDIDISTAISTLEMYRCSLNGDLDTAGDFDHDIDFEFCNFHGHNINSAATGETDINFTNCSRIGTVTNDGTGAISELWIDDTPVDGELHAPISSNWAFDHAAGLFETHGVPADPGADRYLMWDDDPGELVWAAGTVAAHKDTHDPEDGADPLDCAAPSELAGVQAAGEGSAHEFARADHDHQIQASIADDHLVTVDDAAAADNDFARFTANGIEGLTVAEAITALLGAALPENVAIILDPALSADEKYSGICEAGTAGTTVDFGDLLYHDVGEGEWMLAKADVAATSGPVKLGINVTVAQAGNGDPITVLLYGKVRSDGDYDFTVDAPVYISAATAGNLTDTAPTGTTGFVVRIVGYGNTADELFFCPENDWITLV